MAISKEFPVLDSQLTLRGPQSAVSSQVKPMAPSVAAQIAAEKKPAWLKIRPPGGDNYLHIKKLLDERKLHTVCQEARCPNLSECWSTGTATFMLGGDTCTRACRFCAIKTARIPPPLDPAEPEHIAESISVLNLKYVVLTSVNRDDLPDGGATHFAQTIRAIKRRAPHVVVEALVPDFQGIPEQIEIVVDSGLDVYAHNIETVERLQYRVRDPRAGYTQSLMTLRVAKNIAIAKGRKLFTKSAIMLGLGETPDELRESFEDLRGYGVDVLTLGQYLRPTAQHLPVEKFYSPEEFNTLGDEARSYGFMYVASGPMVRSSYKAAEFFIHKAVVETQQSAGEIAQ